jgi:hypothetical protein
MRRKSDEKYAFVAVIVRLRVFEDALISAYVLSIKYLI